MTLRPIRTTLASLSETTLVRERCRWCEGQEKGQVTKTDYFPGAKNLHIWYIPAGLSRIIYIREESAVLRSAQLVSTKAPPRITDNLQLDYYAVHRNRPVLLAGRKQMHEIVLHVVNYL